MIRWLSKKLLRNLIAQHLERLHTTATALDAAMRKHVEQDHKNGHAEMCGFVGQCASMKARIEAHQRVLHAEALALTGGWPWVLSTNDAWYGLITSPGLEGVHLTLTSAEYPGHARLTATEAN